jgi:hypothetical protein
VKRGSLAVLLVVVALLLPGGCGGNSKLDEWLGTSDPAPVQPVVIDFLCDPSRGSSCTEATLLETLDVALAAVAPRPGSVVRVWIQGSDVESTVAVCAVASVKSKRSGRRAIRDAENHWIAKSRQEMLRAVRPHFGTHARRSPIAEAVTRVALSAAPIGAERWIVVVSDGLEVSAFGDFECGKLPRAPTFVTNVQRERVLVPDSLRTIHLRMCHLDLTPIDGGRCPMTLSRAAQVRTLWTTAFKAAGARDVALSDGALSAFTSTNPNKGERNDQ